MKKPPILDIKNVNFSYGTNLLLKDLSFTVSQNEIVSIIGSSGCGKSTIFKLLTGLLKPQKGEIQICGEESISSFENISYMLQDDLLLPWRTVLQNVLLFSELGKNVFESNHFKIQAELLLKEMGLSKCSHMYPEHLSGGMRQRVALARALLQKKPILLLDEPFGSLDVSIREQMYFLLREVKNHHNITILMVTHDFRDALSLSDKILFLNQGAIQKSWNVSQEIKENSLKTATLMEEIRAFFQERS